MSRMHHPDEHAVILIGHGSLRSASGASMIRIAARLRERGVAPSVEAAFLNYSRPTLVETVQKITAQKITERGTPVTTITIQPYFLIAGVYVQNDLRALIAEVSAQHPTIRFQLAPVLGNHPALTTLAQHRLQEQMDASKLDAPALLLMAHGTPLPAANAPLYTVTATLTQRLGLAASCVGYLDCNAPTIPDAIDQLVAGQMIDGRTRQIVALPYFLHLGRHVAEDLPRYIAEAQAKYPDTVIRLAHHLDYDLCLVDAVEGLLPAAQPIAPNTLPVQSEVLPEVEREL